MLSAAGCQPSAVTHMHAYPSLATVHALAAAAGRPFVYGQSVEGRELLAVEVGQGQPTVLVTAGIHGLELVGVQVALEILRRGPLPGLRLIVCPVLNPDGYDQSHRGEARRTNARGVDLNRNFPLPWNARPSALAYLGAGSSRPGDATYRGPAPLSEPETAALVDLLHRERPLVSANLHAFLGTLFAARVWDPQDWQGYRRLARAFRRGQGLPIGYPRVGTPLGDVFTGELEDWQHHVLRCWAVCVECFSLPESIRQHVRAPSLLSRFNPYDPDPVARRDAAGVRVMLAEAAGLPRLPDRPLARVTRDIW